MKALLLVDLQNDFAPGGALPVPDGNAVVPIANRVQSLFDLVVATQDWHPAHHASFAANHPEHQIGDVIDLNGQPQVLWPVHCVHDTIGAALLSDLDASRVERIFRKGTDPHVDSYSAFFDNDHRTATGLADYLRERGVTDVYNLGLATDYCVKFTALDAAALGFRTFLIEDACRGVNLNPGDADRAIQELRRAGVTVVRSDRLADQ